MPGVATESAMPLNADDATLYHNTKGVGGQSFP